LAIGGGAGRTRPECHGVPRIFECGRTGEIGGLAGNS
jgi:hypothetical protein